MKGVDLPFKTIEELRDIAYSIVGEPEKVQFGDRVVGIIEARDGTIMDVVRQIKPYEFAELSKPKTSGCAADICFWCVSATNKPPA